MIKKSETGKVINKDGTVCHPFYKYETIDPTQFPDDWEFIQNYAPANIHVTVIRAQAKDNDPKAKITFVSGFKSSPDEYNIKHVHALQRAGVEFDIIMLPDSGPEIGFLPDFRDIVRDIFLEKPLDDGYKEGIPNYAFAHSLGARAFIRNMMDEDFASHIEEYYTGGVMNAPHFSSPYRESFVARHLYNAYSHKYNKYAFGTTSIDKAVIWATNLKVDIKNQWKRATSHLGDKTVAHIPFNTHSPAQAGASLTHGQISYCNKEGEELWERMIKNPIPQAAKKFPMMMMAGSKDIVSCPQYIKKAANLFDARYSELDAHHNPFFQSEGARRHVLKTMREMTGVWTDLVIQTSDSDNNLNTPPSDIPEFS